MVASVTVFEGREIVARAPYGYIRTTMADRAIDRKHHQVNQQVKKSAISFITSTLLLNSSLIYYVSITSLIPYQNNSNYND